LQRLAAEIDGIVFGYTSRNDRTYKSMNYHRNKIKAGKTLWSKTVSVSEEADFFDTSDYKIWKCDQENYWWISQNASRVVGNFGERVAFFPHCGNHPGPWHGYPVSPSNDEHYEIPEEVVSTWEAGDKPRIDDLVAGRIRKGKI
jgi:hypothetical protein